ncbi:MAG: SDR family oxidoreductase [Nitrospira sp.]|nr:SDR family oxidoreductase [Nitrospira sp.]MBH0195273.1 SDR family oxidoreductase [Nitrospira sp.]
MSRLAGKVAVVTGGNAGIGEAIARTFVREGAAVVITGRRQDELDRVVHEITRRNGKAIAVAGSVTDDCHTRAVVNEAIQRFGSLDILINNAGVGEFGRRLHELDDETWARVLDVNLTGVFRMTRAAVPEMLKRGQGSIVNISSIASLVGIPYLPAYAASKGALDALTRAIAIDYAKDGVRCNVVNPGLIATPMAAPLMTNPEQLNPILDRYPIRRPGKPEEVADMVLYLASDEAKWVTGGTFTIDGGMTVW